MNNPEEVYEFECECGREMEVTYQRLRQTDNVVCSSCGEQHDSLSIIIGTGTSYGDLDVGEVIEIEPLEEKANELEEDLDLSLDDDDGQSGSNSGMSGKGQV